MLVSAIAIRQRTVEIGAKGPSVGRFSVDKA